MTRRRVLHSRRRHTKKTRGGAGFFDFFRQNAVADNKIVQLGLPPSLTQVKCYICGNTHYQIRPSTIGKSKAMNAFTDIVIGDDLVETIANISCVTYFCNNCGAAIMVRDPKSSVQGNYTNLLKPIDPLAQPNVAVSSPVPAPAPAPVPAPAQ